MTEPVGISIIAWTNNEAIYQNYLARSFANFAQLGEEEGDFTFEYIKVMPDDGCKNMGEAYRLGQQRATHRIKAYIHQDVYLLDRTWARKMDIMFNHIKGIGAVGLFGSTVDTGAGYFHCHPRHQVGVSPDLTVAGLPMAECAPVKILDGPMLVTTQAFDWETRYEAQHFFVEDYCMQARAAGLKVMTVDSQHMHRSGGQLNEAYWRCARRFNKKWSYMIPDTTPPLGMFHKFYLECKRKHGGFTRDIVRAGGWDIVWQVWQDQQAQRQAA